MKESFFYIGMVSGEVKVKVRLGFNFGVWIKF